MQQPIGLGSVWGVVDGAQVVVDLGDHRLAWDVGLGVALEVELTALPGHAWKDGLEGGLDAVLVVGDKQRRAMQTTMPERRPRSKVLG